MTPEMQALLVWVQACLIIAAVFTTTFFLVYTFTGWFRYALGRMIWTQAFGFALAIDLTAIFQFWVPKNQMILFWVNVIGFTIIAAASAALTIMLFKMHLARRKREKKEKEKEEDGRVHQLYPEARA